MNTSTKIKLTRLVNKMADEKNCSYIVNNSSLCRNSDFYNSDLIKNVLGLNCDVSKKLKFLNTLVQTYGIEMHDMFDKYAKNTAVDFTSFMNNEFLNKERVKPTDYQTLYETLMVFQAYEYNFFIPGIENCNMVDFISKIYEDLERKNHMKAGIFKDLRIDIFNGNFEIFARNLINLDDEEAKKYVESIYGEINYKDISGSLLHRCQSDSRLSNTEKLMVTEKLLDIGVDPYIEHLYGSTFIDVAIPNNNENYIYQIINKAIKHGFQPNGHNKIIFGLLDKENIDLLKFLKLLCNNGVVLHDFYFDQIMHSKWAKNNSDKLDEVLTFISVKKEINNLEYMLKYEKHYFVEEDFTNILGQCDDSIYDIVNKVKLLVSTDIFSHSWANAIENNRNNSVNVVDRKITAVDALKALNDLIREHVKVLENDVNDCIEKVLVYDNKIKN